MKPLPYRTTATTSLDRGKGMFMRAMVAVTAVCCSIAGLSMAAAADASIRKSVSIAAQGLGPALQTLAKEHQLHIVFIAEDVNRLTTRGASGDLTIDEALTRILSGTGLTYQFLEDDTVTILPLARGSDTGRRAGGEWLRVAQAAGPSSASAADTGTRIEEVVVTAQKRAQRSIDVPLSITALNGEQLERAGVNTLKDLSYSVPSLVVSDAGGGFQRYFIRGIGNAYSSTSLVGVYLDEADVTSNSLSQLDLRAVDLERVEVLKGPQGTLYGAGSSGGTVRFITRDPQLDRFTAEGNLDLAFTRAGSASQSVSAVLNMPLVTDKLGVRIVGNYGNLGGWIDQPAAGRKDINNQNLREVRAKALWRPTDELAIKAMVYIHRNDGDGITGGADQDNNVAVPVDAGRRGIGFSADFNLYNLTATYDFPTMSLLSTTTYMESPTSATIGLRYAVEPPPAAPFEVLNYPDTRDTEGFTQEFRLSSRPGGRWNWTAGLFYKDLSIDYTTNIEFGQGGVPLGGLRLESHETTKSGALFGDVSYAFTDRLEAGVGARYFNDRRTDSRPDTPDRKGSFHSLDPRLYLSYAVAPDVRLYASVADGFRSGGFNGEDGRLTTFDPEKVRSYELGTKMSLLERRLRAEVALFYSDYEDIQMFRLSSDGVTGSVDNGGTAHVKGVDWAFEWQATEQLLLELGGNVSDTEIVKLLPGVAAVIEGDPIDFSTDYTVRVAGTYAFDWAAGMPGFVRLDYSRIGPSHTTDRSIPVPILYQSEVNDLVNARLGLQWNRWSFELYGDNLTDENRLQDPAGGFGFGSRPRPRTIGLQVRAMTE